ncbi:hypothetical protein N9J49_06725, partial [Amylibacter sp.]|nr:hypothetical protein [Amylibacter sp.]
NLLRGSGREAIFCSDENEARELINTLDLEKFWPINIFNSDTAGEKPFEEFYTSREELYYEKFKELAYVNFTPEKTRLEVSSFLTRISNIDCSAETAREQYLECLVDFVPSFDYVHSNRFLNSRM